MDGMSSLVVAGTGLAIEADESLVARVVEGDSAAFATLMHRHNRRIYRVVRSILKIEEEAEDAMQEAYVSAFTHLRDFGGRSRFSTWLMRIAVHESLGRLRRRKQHASLNDSAFEDELLATTRNPEGAARDVELRALLEAAVDALPVGFRTVFVMRAVEELSVDETAEALDIPAETVRTRLHRAHTMLRASLAQQLESAAPRAFDFHLSRCARITTAVLERISHS